MTNLKLHTPNLTQSNISRIRELFPNCITETLDANGQPKPAIDFDQLRQELSESIVEGPQERYQLSWPGKREALLTANAPIAKTLRPCREESVDFDTTQNLFIEGDNLDALKLLQETYLGKVKIIYIDPPYNTGQDFIYEDDFAENSDGFLKRSNQKDELGNRLIANPESNGRFHSDWLSMMYSRLKIAYNFLADDGVIGVSIDDHEVFQMGKLLDEIFGHSNRLACAPWLSEASGGKEKTGLRTGHEYLLIYFKTTSVNISQEERSVGELNLTDIHGAYRKGRELMKWGGNSLRKDRPNQFYELVTPSGEKVLPFRNDGKEGHWRWGKDNLEIKKAAIDEFVFHWEIRKYDIGVFVDGKAERWVPYEKIREIKKSIGWSTWLDKHGTNADATRELKDLFGEKYFDTPKPTSLIKWFFSLHSDSDCIVLDFFAGSASTAHSVLSLNLEDDGNRSFILVQLPIQYDSSHPAYLSGYKTVPQFACERIRRAGKKIKEELAAKKSTDQTLFTETEQAKELDIGFRVLKVDTSNMADVYYVPDAVKQDQLGLNIDNVKPGRTAEDLLFQVLLDWGVDLTLPIRRETIQGKTVFFVNHSPYDLIACFDHGVNEDLVKELARHEALRVVFRDNGFESDAVKINVDQIFKQLSPGTEVRAI